MKRIIFLIFMLFSFGSFAQQGLQMEFGELDSSEVLQQRQIEYYQLINGISNSEFVNAVKLPAYQFNPAVGNPYMFNFTTQPLFANNYTAFSNYELISPYFYNGEVLSSAAHQIGNNLLIGGFSYGANSMMSAPLPNQMGRSFDTYGSTLFMQYKVSKNFKIETRVTVGQHNGPLPPGF